MLFAYLAVVSVVTILSIIFGEQVLHVFATSPDEVARSGVWTILMSGLIVQGPAVSQIVATAVLAVIAIRLAGARVFWSAAVVAHLAATLLVYAGVWIADAATPGSGTPLSRELDFGISLVWCAALGVLAAAGWWSTWRLPPWLRYTLSLAPPAAIVVVTLGSDGLARYEHAVAFALAVLVVFVCRRWVSLGRRLRLLWLVSDGSS